jgi:uncharacterized spore protein YtfJ
MTTTRTQLTLSEQENMFIEGVVKKLADNARAAVVFADPVEREGLTIIPIARLSWGFGGGTGSDKKGTSSGMGGGGGITAVPVGYIELKGGKARFSPIVDFSKIIPVAIVLSLLISLLLRRLAKRPKARQLVQPAKSEIPAVTPQASDGKVEEAVTVS